MEPPVTTERNTKAGLPPPQSNGTSYDEEREDFESEWTATSDDENYFFHDRYLF